MEGVGQTRFQGVVEPVDVLPRLVEGEPAAEDLQPQVVLLVDHHADRLLVVEGDAAGSVEHGGEFPADELPLEEKLPVERGQAGDVEEV